ncbi:MAG: YlxR family protein [Actinomycetota bacterium]
MSEARSVTTKIGSGPIRTCVGCRRRRGQAEMLRVARSPDGTIAVDPKVSGGPERSSRGAGRGAYLCADRACVEQAMSRRALRRALRCEIGSPARLRDELIERIASTSGASRGDAAAGRRHGEEGRHG